MGPLAIIWGRELRKKIAWRSCFKKKIFCNCQGTNELYLRMPAKALLPKCALHSGESREEMYFNLFHFQNWKTTDFKSQKFFKLKKRLSLIFIQEKVKPYIMPYKTYSEINGAILHVCIYSSQLKLGGRVHDILSSSGLEQLLCLYFRLLS